MASPSPPLPSLSPAFCFSHGTLLAFLNSSRHMIDDSISTNLNALSTPSRTSPLSTSGGRASPQRRTIARTACDTFISTVLFPAWQTREQVLDYCTGVARAQAAAQAAAEDPAVTAARVQQSKNERLDPYSGRYFPQQSRGELLADFCRRERLVEDIVRERSWDVVRSRCDVDVDADELVESSREKLYVGAFDRWKKSRAEESRSL